MKSFKNALIAMRRSPYQTLIAILMMSVTSFIAYKFSLTMAGTEMVLRYFEKQPQIIAFFEIGTEPSNLENISSTLQEKSYVESVKIVDNNQALELYKIEHQDDPLLLELVNSDILPNSIEVSSNDLETLALIKKDLEAAPQVDEVIYQQDIVDELKKWTKSVRLQGLVQSISLFVVSFLIVIVIISMKIAQNKYSINIMRIIGATKWYIKTPYLIEGFLYGLFGSILGWTAMYINLLYETPQLKEILQGIIQLPVPLEFLLVQLGIGTTVAAILGALAAMMAAQRVIRK